MLEQMGITLQYDGQYPTMPKIAWHDSRSCFPGDTIQEALELCRQTFNEPAQIVFVNLPTTAVDLYQVSAAALAVCECTTLRRIGLLVQC